MSLWPDKNIKKLFRDFRFSRNIFWKLSFCSYQKINFIELAIQNFTINLNFENFTKLCKLVALWRHRNYTFHAPPTKVQMAGILWLTWRRSSQETRTSIKPGRKSAPIPKLTSRVIPFKNKKPGIKFNPASRYIQRKSRDILYYLLLHFVPRVCFVCSFFFVFEMGLPPRRRNGASWWPPVPATVATDDDHKRDPRKLSHACVCEGIMTS